MLMYYTYSKKRFFSYDYCDSFEKFDKALSNKDEFYNSMTNCKTGDNNLE